MRAVKAREIRKALGVDLKNPNPTLKKVYRRAKKVYSRLSKHTKQDFIQLLNNK